jgi:hypothetical protein
MREHAFSAERRYLYQWVRDSFTGRGKIVDAGCLFGGSTVALLSGLEGRNDGAGNNAVHSFDLFTAGPDHFEFIESLGGALRQVFVKCEKPGFQEKSCIVLGEVSKRLSFDDAKFAVVPVVPHRLDTLQACR